MRRLVLICVFALAADPCPARVITVADDSPDWADTLMPATQCGHTTSADADTRFEKQDLCEPVGHKGGNHRWR